MRCVGGAGPSPPSVAASHQRLVASVTATVPRWGHSGEAAEAHRSTPTLRPRLLVINQYFASREATGQLLAELCAHLADRFDISVSAPPAMSAGGRDPVDPRIRVLHVRTTRFGRDSLVLRALNYLSFLGGLPIAALRTGKPDIVMCLTDPPSRGTRRTCCSTT